MYDSPRIRQSHSSLKFEDHAIEAPKNPQNTQKLVTRHFMTKTEIKSDGVYLRKKVC